LRLHSEDFDRYTLSGACGRLFGGGGRLEKILVCKKVSKGNILKWALTVTILM